MEHDSSDQPSKSQIKKAMHDIQKIGQSLLELSATQLAKVPMPDNLRQAIEHGQTLKKNNESMRRHLQYIGKLMREIELAPILAAVQKIQMHRDQRTKEFHAVEKWRDQMIAKGDDALNEFIQLYPDTDRQQLRQLIRNAQHDRAQEKKTGGELALFRYLRDILNPT